MGSLEGNVDHLDATFTTWISAALLVAASALFVGAEVSINAVNGWWGDELASLWSSDVSLPFTRAFSERIVLDNTPPLYYIVLYWVRWLISDDRTAILAVNIAAIMIAAGAVFVASRRAGLSKLAVVRDSRVCIKWPRSVVCVRGAQLLPRHGSCFCRLLVRCTGD